MELPKWGGISGFGSTTPGTGEAISPVPLHIKIEDSCKGVVFELRDRVHHPGPSLHLVLSGVRLNLQGKCLMHDTASCCRVPEQRDSTL